MEDCFSLLFSQFHISSIPETANQSWNYNRIHLFLLKGFDNFGEDGLADTRFLLIFIRRSDQVRYSLIFEPSSFDMH